MSGQNPTITNRNETVRAELGDRSYDVLIGTGLIACLLEHASARFGEARYAIVTDENVALAHLATIEAPLKEAGKWRTSIVLPAGEQTKSFEQLQYLSEALLAAGTERGDVVIALGGGVQLSWLHLRFRHCRCLSYRSPVRGGW